MSRSGYTDEEPYDGAFAMWRGAVESATRGKRGQALLRDLLAGLDAMPVKRLIREELIDQDGEVCALGACAIKRGIKVDDIDESEPVDVAYAFNIAPALAAEIAYQNDECGRGAETPEDRWIRIRAWVASQLTGAAVLDAEKPEAGRGSA